MARKKLPAAPADPIRKPVYAELRVDAITIDKGFNVFDAVDEQTLFELGDSMASDGQLMPIIVNQTGDEEYHLIAGEQRLTALREGNTETVECKIYRDVEPVQAMRMHVIENLRRRRPKPMEEARGIQRFRGFGYTTAKIAEVYGASEDTILKREKLLGLPAEVQRMIERDVCPLPIHQALLLEKLSESDAIQLARQIAPKTGPILGEKESRELVERHTQGPNLPGLNPSSRTKVDSPASSPAKSAAVDSTAKTPTTAPAAADPQQKKNAKACELKAVDGMIGIVGKLGIDADGCLSIGNATVTIKLERKMPSGKGHPELHSVKLKQLGLNIGAADTAAVIKLVKKCQPAEKA